MKYKQNVEANHQKKKKNAAYVCFEMSSFESFKLGVCPSENEAWA